MFAFPVKCFWKVSQSSCFVLIITLSCSACSSHASLGGLAGGQGLIQGRGSACHYETLWQRGDRQCQVATLCDGVSKNTPSASTHGTTALPPPHVPGRQQGHEQPAPSLLSPRPLQSRSLSILSTTVALATCLLLLPHVDNQVVTGKHSDLLRGHSTT